MGNVLTTVLKAAQGPVYPIDNRGGWSPFIREPYAGAWQNNDSWTIDNVLAYPPVFACVSVIADDIGKLPPTTIRKDNGIWVRYTDPKIEKLLQRPNRFQNHIQFKQWWITSKLTRGNTYVLKQRNAGGEVVALYVLDTCRVLPLVAPDGSVYYQLGQDWLNGVQESSVTVPASEIMHDRMNCLFHPLVGISPLFASGLAASQGLKIQAESSKFFENGARPSGVLTAPGEISQTTADRIKTHWDAGYTGVNAGKVAVLGDGMSFVPMRMTALDAQVVQLLDWSDSAIAATFKVPGYKVGVGDVPSANNVEALTLEYFQQCLQVHIESMEICMDQGLDMPTDRGIELDLDALFRMDSSTLVKMLSEGVKGTVMTPNYALRRLNQPPVEGGDTLYMQQQNYSLAALSKRDDREDPFATGSKAPATEPPMPPDDPDKAFDGAAYATALSGITQAVISKQLPPAVAANIIQCSFPDLPIEVIDNLLRAAELAILPEPVAVEDNAADVLKLLPMYLQEELHSEG